jgi:ketosteroid isomerase-like protein
MPTPEEEVLQANAAFYGAFARRDLAAMDALWAKEAPVACIHPGWPALRGREEVMASWRAIFGGGGAPPIRCSRAVASRLGDGNAAYVVCRESLPGAELIATNLFVREEGRWKMCHHHAGPVARGAEDEPDVPPEGGSLH